MPRDRPVLRPQPLAMRSATNVTLLMLANGVCELAQPNSRSFSQSHRAVPNPFAAFRCNQDHLLKGSQIVLLFSLAYAVGKRRQCS